MARVVLDSGEIPYILDGHNSSTADPDKSVGLWPLDTIAYCTEGIAASGLHFPQTSQKVAAQFKSTVDYLLQTQGSEGYWGTLGSGDLERSPRVLSLLSFWLNATSRRGYVDLPTTEAAARYVTYLVSHGVSTPGDKYGVGLQTITSGMAGIAVADSLSFGSSFGVQCAGCAMKSDDDAISLNPHCHIDNSTGIAWVRCPSQNDGKPMLTIGANHASNNCVGPGVGSDPGDPSGVALCATQECTCMTWDSSINKSAYRLTTLALYGDDDGWANNTATRLRSWSKTTSNQINL